MATLKSTPENTSADQRGKTTSTGNNVGGNTSRKQPGDRTTEEETRNTGLAGAQRTGTGNTDAGAKARGAGVTSNVKPDGDRTDREVASGRTTGQNPTGDRQTNDGELRDEDEEDNEPLPGADDAQRDSGVGEDEPTARVK